MHYKTTAKTRKQTEDFILIQTQVIQIYHALQIQTQQNLTSVLKVVQESGSPLSSLLPSPPLSSLPFFPGVCGRALAEIEFGAF